MYKGANIDRDENPRERAGLFNILFYLFTFDVFRKTAKRELQEDDVYTVLTDYKASRLGDQLEKAWDYQRKKPKISLTSTLFSVYGREYMTYGFMNLFIKTFLMISQPMAIGKLVSYFAINSTLTKFDAYFYATVVIVCTLFSSIYNHYYMLKMQELGLRIKVALCSLMYRKSLKLTTTSLINFTGGKIVTMISKDVLVFESALVFAHDLWIGFIQLFVMTFIMSKQIGVAAVIGVLVLVVLIPFQIWLGVITKNLRLKTSAKTDERLRTIQEILVSIKLIKLYTWEKYYTKIVNALRSTEMRWLRYIFYLKSCVLTISALSQRFSFYICILVYIMLGGIATAEKVFIVMGCYNALRFILTVAIPMGVSQVAEAKSALKRMKEFLLIDDIETIEKRPIIIRDPKIFIKSGSVSILDKPVLRDINLEAKKSLIGITGPVGSGKSTFLKLIMQDVHIDDGSVHTSGEISYASQEPWLFPGTIRQNILFGLPYERERYRKVITVCALNRDLAVFPESDNTICNDKGLNLSKGQQARINLARAVYRKADIYLLDDVLSALDASVSKYVFEECFQKFLKDKLTITVCHNKKFLAECDRVLVFDKHTIMADGTYKKLEAKGIDFGMHQSLESEVPVSEPSKEKMANEALNAEETCKMLVSNDKDLDNAVLYGEVKAEGKVSYAVYGQYFNHAGGWFLITLFLILCVITQFAISYFDYYITHWLKVEENLSIVKASNDTSSEVMQSAVEAHVKAMYMYTGIILVATILAVARLFSFFGLTTRASNSLHNKIWSVITAASMSFFDRHLSGNILNRFSKDIGVVDEYMPYAYIECIRIFFMCLGTIVVIAKVNPMLLIPTAFILVIMLVLRIFFLKSSRSLRRLDGITRSPVIGYLNSSLEGLTTIRASKNEEVLKLQFDGHQDLNCSAAYMAMATSRAFGFWLDMMCAVYTALIVYSFIIIDSSQFAGNVGLAITQAFGLTGILQWGIRNWAEVENLMTSVERVLEYQTAEPEDHSGRDADNWPSEGRIEYKDVGLRYTNSDKLILNGVNFVINPTEKVGIIGRTGAGKSSIISVLFRLYDVEGKILIDGLDIKQLKLDTVRSQISIIPQDPVLFAGTIRSNLDPHNQHTDLELWRTLEEVELKGLVENFDMGLSSIVNEGGANFSIGQRQLICLARAILRNNKILVLDEATANVDPQTDELIQRTIKKLFDHCTILTVAHRLNTIINADKIMVVDFGTIVEFDTPQKLLAKGEGVFYTLAKQAGIVN